MEGISQGWWGSVRVLVHGARRSEQSRVRVDRSTDPILLYKQGLRQRRTGTLGPILAPVRKRRNRRRRWKDLPRPKLADPQIIVNALCYPFRANTGHTRTFGVAFLLDIDMDISACMSLLELRFWTRGDLLLTLFCFLSGTISQHIVRVRLDSYPSEH